MAVLHLQVSNGSSFLVRRLKKSALDAAKVSAMIAAKLRSLLVSCPRCSEGCHPQETICFSPEAEDCPTLAIMVELLEGRILDPTHFAFLDDCAVMQYLLIMEDYLTPNLLPCMSDEDTLSSPTTLKGIELLYVAGNQALAKHLTF